MDSIRNLQTWTDRDLPEICQQCPSRDNCPYGHNLKNEQIAQDAMQMHRDDVQMRAAEVLNAMLARMLGA